MPIPPPSSLRPAAPLPNHEAERQRALEHYQILDTGSEFAFDDLTRLASLVCQTPISLITLLDRDRQWFKAKFGIDCEEVPREHSFCDYVVGQKSQVEVSNALIDDRFNQNPMVTGPPNIRFYAGVPLRTAEDYCLGTICVLDTVPRALTDAQWQALLTIAEQVMAQLELKVRNRELADGYAPGAHRDQLPEQFIGMVTHDFKPPLASLLGLTDMLVSDARAGKADAVCETLTVMNAELDRAQRFVEGLLRFARAVRPDETTETVDVPELLHELIRSLPGADAFHFTLAPGLPVLRTSRVALRQVFQQLLHNAVRHHPQGTGRIAVTAEPGPGKHYVTFQVRDDGAGIPPAAQERVFGFFQRRPDVPATDGAGGMGLPAVKHLVEANGGHIHLHSEPGQGATFTFSWRAAPATNA